jgi:hypothetical protein
MAAPLFLLAPPRSFTSVINAMIGQHPQAFGLPELNLFFSDKIIELWYPNLKDFYFDEKLRHGLLRAVAEIYTGEQTDESIEFAEHWCGLRENNFTGDVFNELKDKLHPLIPVDKSPGYTIEIERMERIFKACPDARFIHLTRHPVKQCESTMELNNAMFPRFVNTIEYQEGRAIIEPQLAWHDLNINILNFLEKNVPKDQYMHVRGEEILENPGDKLAEICRWLGIRDDSEAVEAMMHPEQSPFACFGPITALFGNDPKFLKGAKFRKGKIKTPTLDMPVKWRDDGKGLYPQVIELAKEFGYT